MRVDIERIDIERVYEFVAGKWLNRVSSIRVLCQPSGVHSKLVRQRLQYRYTKDLRPPKEIIFTQLRVAVLGFVCVLCVKRGKREQRSSLHRFRDSCSTPLSMRIRRSHYCLANQLARL